MFLEHFAYVYAPTTSDIPVGSIIDAIFAAARVIYSGVKDEVSVFRISTIDFAPSICELSPCRPELIMLIVSSLESAIFFNLSYSSLS